MRNHLLSITRRTIPYLPDLRPIAGSVTASILMQQLDYWFSQKPDGFYKFLSPFGHEAYREGDSWEEELAFSVDEFRTAFDRIGVRHGSKKAYKAAVASGSEFIAEAKDGTTTVKFYSSYHDKIKGLTFYFRNHPVVDERLNSLVSGNFPVNGKSPSTEMGTPNHPSSVNGESPATEMEKPSSVNGESPVHLYTEITPEITPEITLPPTPQGGQKSVEEKRPRNGTKPPAPNINAVATLVKEEVIQQSTVICEDKSSASAVTTKKKVSESTKWRQERRREVHPNLVYCEGETAWLNPDSQFKAEFVRWIASEWMKKWTYSTIYAAEEAVISNFFNEPDKIPVRWRTYSLTFNHHFERAAQRIASGGTVGEEEKQHLEANLEAVRSPMPQTVVSESTTTLLRDTTTPILPVSAPASLENFEGSPDTYREYKPELEVSQEEAQANLLRLKEMMGAISARKLPPPQEPKPINRLDQLNADLADPCIGRSRDIQVQAQKFIDSNEGYCADYDDEGKIVVIYQF